MYEPYWKNGEIPASYVSLWEGNFFVEHVDQVELTY